LTILHICTTFMEYDQYKTEEVQIVLFTDVCMLTNNLEKIWTPTFRSDSFKKWVSMFLQNLK